MIGARVFGGVLLAIGAVALIATLGVGDDWSASGPRLAPAVSAVFLMGLSIAFLLWPGDDLPELIEESTRGTHWPTPVMLIGLLLAYILLLEALGYGLATAIFFWLASWLLGSERPARDAVVAVALGVVTSYAFSHWLNVQLPTGPWGV